MIETVGIPVDDDNKGSSRLTACVSSQVLSVEPLLLGTVIQMLVCVPMFLSFDTCNAYTGRLPPALLILCHGQGRVCKEPSTT